MFKSLEYLKEIKKNCCLSNDEFIEVLEKIGYIITDNNEEYDEGGARYLLDDIAAAIDNKEIEL